MSLIHNNPTSAVHHHQARRTFVLWSVWFGKHCGFTSENKASVMIWTLCGIFSVLCASVVFLCAQVLCRYWAWLPWWLELLPLTPAAHLIISTGLNPPGFSPLAAGVCDVCSFVTLLLSAQTPAHLPPTRTPLWISPEPPPEPQPFTLCRPVTLYISSPNVLLSLQ